MASVTSLVSSVASDPLHKSGVSSSLDCFESLAKFCAPDAPRHGWFFRSRVARMDDRPTVWVDPIDGIVYREDFSGDFIALNR